MTNLWKGTEPLVLASTSVTRLQLLKTIAIPVEAITPTIDERSIEKELQARCVPPDQIALELARAKAADVSAQAPGRWVVAADQTLALGLEQFHKPASLQQAGDQLMQLAGKTHQLHSAIVCYRNGRSVFEDIQTASLTMRKFGPDFIEAYLREAGETVTKSVGAYQAEGLGVHLFERAEGDHFTILGLPLFGLLSCFRTLDLIPA